MGEAVAIVLARGGSKGLPRKNVRPVAGKPCIAWTIEHARAAASVRAVVLSTDDAEIASVGRGCGARVVRRSAERAGDRATVDDAAREALGCIERGDWWDEGQGGEAGHGTRDTLRAEVIVLLYGNVPVRPAGLVDRAVRMLVEHEADSVQSYAPVGKFHPWWMARVDEQSGAVRPWEGEVLNHGVFRRQDLPPAFVPDGGVIAVRRAALMLEIAGVRPGPHAFFGREDRRRGVITGEGEVVDVDTAVDLMVAEAMLAEKARRH